jgi:hypothetical protein
MFPPKKKKMMDGDGPGMPPPVEEMEPTEGHEAEETPAFEATEEAGASFVDSVLQAGEAFGLSPEDSKQFAGRVLQGAADLLLNGAQVEPEETTEVAEEGAE